ncbi:MULTISPECIES: hypothetical protein [Clostridium]|uniref:Uncharacterized protein n=1 Tax=Clostridium disporicum TaxID=84024 RepID=A0A174EYN7_9CLOT|nr:MULTISPECIES: hypothetical protein [Clostridium]MDU3522785.1 hypothetical protein [Clostridium saudiense]CUO43212.1 Uncharacterised protein [Clostridium disporicum]
MKAWESMTNAERAEQTYRDLRLRQERRRAGVREADNFMFNNILKAKRNRDKITAKKYRQRW